VAVAEPYRGRGIARALMDAAIELVREWEGKVITLQVRDDNAPAVHIYRTMGFQEIFGTTYLRLDHATAVESVPIDGAHLRPRDFTNSDAHKEYELARAATPEKAQTEHPIRFARYRLGFEERLADWARPLLGGGPTLRLVLDGMHHFEASVTAETGTWWREGRLSLMVHPASRGQVEKQMLSPAMLHMSRWPRRMIRALHPTYHPQGIEAFKAFGFRAERTLLWMRRDL
jgi:GNAT superfamily N-acetyltransferase